MGVCLETSQRSIQNIRYFMGLQSSFFSQLLHKNDPKTAGFGHIGQSWALRFFQPFIRTTPGNEETNVLTSEYKFLMHFLSVPLLFVIPEIVPALASMGSMMATAHLSCQTPACLATN